MSLKRHIVEFLRTREMLGRGTSFVVAASGGVDSTVLACLMAEVCADWDARLTLAYIHHGLRDAASSELDFVADLASQLGADFSTRTIPVLPEAERTGLSVQAAARTLRYEALEQIRLEASADWVLTAHHADDQAETLLGHFLRGSGVDGLTGIRDVLGTIARPIIEIPRTVIEQYAGHHGIDWREDASNAEDYYRRNAIRHHLMPVIREHVQPGVTRVLSDTSRLFNSLSAYLRIRTDELASEALRRSENDVCLVVSVLKRYFEFEQLLLIRRALADIGVISAGYDETDAVLGLIDSGVGKHVALRGGFVAFRERDVVAIRADASVPEDRKTALGEEIVIGSVRFTSREISSPDVEFSDSPNREYIDLDTTGTDWVLRPWSAGDVIHPIGMKGRKNVSDLLADARIPPSRKKEVLLLEGEKGVIWICGVRLDDRCKISPDSRRIAMLSIADAHEE